MAQHDVVLVGAGGMGRAWARNLIDHGGVRIAAWVDVRLESAQRAVEEFQLQDAAPTDNLEKALVEVKPSFLIDVTVPEAHCEVTLTSLKHGVPVLGEKPMASSMEEARRMVRASEEAGKLYMVSQSRRYDARLTAYRRMITRLGDLGILNSDFYIGAHFGGFREEMPSPLLLDMAIHTFDQARYLSGADPVRVFCDEFNPSWSWYGNAASATCIFEMANGLRYTYRGSWCAEGRNTSWEADWRAVGSKGSATWNGFTEIQGDQVKATGGFFSEFEADQEPIEENVPGGIAGSLRDFLNAIETGATPMGECHDNIKSLAMVFGAIESAKRRSWVEIAELLDA